MLRSHCLRSKAIIDLPNRLLSVAQVCPVSSGHTIASVQSEVSIVDDMHIPAVSENGFYNTADMLMDSYTGVYMETDKKIPVKIKITGIHRSTDAALSDAPDETVEESFGFLSKRGSSIYIVYETKEGEEITVSNMIKINPETNEIKKTSTLRKGTITSPASSLMYISGSSGTGFYTTPYGRLDTTTHTDKIMIIENDNSFICTMSGNMEINNSPVSEFDLKIEAVII